jgi:hypothetical protein
MIKWKKYIIVLVQLFFHFVQTPDRKASLSDVLSQILAASTGLYVQVDLQASRRDDFDLPAGALQASPLPLALARTPLR